MISGTISFFSGDSLRVENESKISFETLVFHNVNFLSYDHSFDYTFWWPLETGILIVQFVKQVRMKQNFQQPVWIGYLNKFQKVPRHPWAANSLRTTALIVYSFQGSHKKIKGCDSGSSILQM